jgi:hypothetical protein
VLKWVIKTIFINSNPFAFLIINVKILPIFKRNGAHLVFKKRIVHFRGLSALNMQKHFLFLLSFECVSFLWASYLLFI